MQMQSERENLREKNNNNSGNGSSNRQSHHASIIVPLISETVENECHMPIIDFIQQIQIHTPLQN